MKVITDETNAFTFSGATKSMITVWPAMHDGLGLVLFLTTSPSLCGRSVLSHALPFAIVARFVDSDSDRRKASLASVSHSHSYFATAACG